MSKKQTWHTVSAENLVKHRSGVYYLQAKVGGHKVRKSLETTVLRIAKIKRDTMLQELRSKEGRKMEISTVGDALQIIRAQQLDDPSLKASTLKYRREVIDAVAATLPVDLPAGTFDDIQIRKWWKSYTKRYSPTRSNAALGCVRKICALLKDSHIRSDDPSEGIKRMRVPESDLTLPEKELIPQIIIDIAKQKKATSVEASNIAAFLAYSGLRIGELNRLRWEDISDKWIFVKGGADGAKNWKGRRTPIIPAMKKLLDQIRPENPSGLIFRQKGIKMSLRRACERLGIEPYLTHHDMRHLFITTCLESSVEVPVVADWVGHKDGGKLLLERYKHIRDEHGLDVAAKVQF